MDKQEAEWGKFSAGLWGYIEDGWNRFVKTDYTINLNMSAVEVLHELQEFRSINELSPELQRVANEYLNFWADK